MKAVIQRVSSARVDVGEETLGQIETGLLVLLGVAEGDTETECDQLARKTAELRIFEDAAGKMNRSLCDIGGEALVVSQFTLCADCSHGRRPSFIGAAAPSAAIPLYERFMQRLRLSPGVRNVQSGRFGADMKVSLVNDGPVTILLDTEQFKKH